MKYLDEYRDSALARDLARAIRAEARPDRDYRLMEFCGGHTHAIFRYGVQDLMPENLRFVHGPGCPVCVLPMARIDQAIAMATQHQVTLCTYGDLMRVPASERQSLLKAKAAGADIRMVYSTQDALNLARAESQPGTRGRQVVFFAIGFETTTPPTAVALKTARAEGLGNFSVFCNHVLTPPALRAILGGRGGDASAGAEPDTTGGSASESTSAGAESGAETSASIQIDGILGPSHVSTVIGSDAYGFVAREHGIPLVIAGFEPLDVMQSALMLVRLINQGRSDLQNQYSRAVTARGNIKAQALMRETLITRDSFEWRGLGWLPDSALRVADDYADWDAERRFPVTAGPSREIKGCECPKVLRGLMEPTECKLFGTLCSPENPMGACMVSSEGACAAYWSYGRSRQPAAKPSASPA